MPTSNQEVQIDALALAQALIRRPSVTPKDAGALDVLEAVLKDIGFTTHRLPFGDIDNLYARLGDVSPHFCFAGHTDVVPVGEGWNADPFAAEVKDGMLYGRGAADMKSAIAAFVAAAARVGAPPEQFKGSISLLITGDEEGIAVNGTVKLLEWLKARGEKIDHCVVGEPTSVGQAGDTLKSAAAARSTSRLPSPACRAMSAIRRKPRTLSRRWPNW